MLPVDDFLDVYQHPSGEAQQAPSILRQAPGISEEGGDPAAGPAVAREERDAHSAARAAGPGEDD